VGDRAFVACDGGQVVALDCATGQEAGSVPIPGAPDAIWFDTRNGHLYVAIGKPGLISVIDTAAMEVVEKVATEEGAGTTAFDGERRQLYVFLPGSSRVAVYDAG
jgi:DNA-binding beta-propeller fold protein YncE